MVMPDKGKGKDKGSIKWSTVQAAKGCESCLNSC